SCPVVFAWNGEHFEFISDIIGPAIVGHWVGPGERNLSDPDEYIKIEGARLRPREGRLLVRFMEPMEELVYLDQARLLAVDHPAEVEVYPNERFAATPPFPEFKIIASRDTRLPAGAWDGRGRDVRDVLRERDRRYVGPAELSSFKGFAALHALELDLGELDPTMPLRLLMHGYTDYFTATSLYAAHQAGVSPVLPYVEALLPEGRWARVADDIGFPAGLRRTMVAELSGRLPAGTRRIRILTNLQIYWDQILVDTTVEESSVRVSEAPLAETNLRFRGYPRQVDGASPGEVAYSYSEVSQTGPYARHRGGYTRYGEVRELLQEADSRFAIFGSGEEVALAFDAEALPALPPGWTRDYFFYANGFVKDMDFYEAHALTVAPLPYHGMGIYPYPADKSYPLGEAYLRYLLDYNDRLVSGSESHTFRYQYRRVPD
ncbi:MAG: FG-GAP-like repeat-containing protein, partial [Candidatus Acidiferrales bacterium]